MAILVIDGVEMPDPSGMEIGIMDISKAERNARGTMIKELIATKRKIDISWEVLNQTQMSKVLNAVNKNFFQVTYTDPVTANERTGTFYVGDRKLAVLKYQNGVPLYKNFAFSVIER